MLKKQAVVIYLLIFAFLLASCTVVMPDDNSSFDMSSAGESVASDITAESSDDASSDAQSQTQSEAESKGNSSSEASSESSSEASNEASDETSSETSSETSGESGNLIQKPDPLRRDQLVAVYLTPEGEINKDEYVTCGIKIIDPTGRFDTVEDLGACIKVRGNSTSSGDKKPYNIKFSKKTDVLGMGECKKWYLLANMYDKSLLRNKLAYDFASEAGLAYTQQSTFCEVYVSGKYVGNYQICESIGVGESRVDIDITKNEFLLEYEPWEGYSNPEWIKTPRYGILFGFNDPESPLAQQRTWLNSFFIELERALAGGRRDKIAEYMDIDSFVNDYIVHEYFKNVDAQTSSTRYYIKDGKLYGGPVWDFDLSAGNADRGYYRNYYDKQGNSYTGWWCRHLWYKYLFETDWFEDEVKARFAELQPVIVNLYQDNELGDNRIDCLLAEFGEGFYANYDGVWNINHKDSDFECRPVGNYTACINYLRDWLRERNNWMKSEWGID